MTIAFIEDRKVQKLSSTADQPRMSIIDSNQNTMNKMLQQLVTCNNQDRSAANYLQNQKNTFNNHQKNIVINTGAYNYQKQQNTPTA